MFGLFIIFNFFKRDTPRENVYALKFPPENIKLEESVPYAVHFKNIGSVVDFISSKKGS